MGHPSDFCGPEHLRDRYDEMLISGMTEVQAAGTLRMEMTDGTLLSGLQAALPPKDATHFAAEDSNSLRSGIWNDLRHGGRLLRKNPSFAIVAMLASLLPAQRAASVQPMAALREE